MTRADDLRADLVQKVNSYILDNLDPELAEEEDEAIPEAGDIVDLVLQAAYEQTVTDLDVIAEEMRQAPFYARRADGRLVYEPEAAQLPWWRTWPDTAAMHAQERYAGTATDVEPEREARRPICTCDAPDVACAVHEPELFEAGIPVDD